MLSRRRHERRALSEAASSVVIVGHARSGDCEGVIDRIRYLGGRERVEARLVLSDGSPAVAEMGADEWEWLELRVGDIVSVLAPDRAVSVSA